MGVDKSKNIKEPKTTLLKDYIAPTFLVPRIELLFNVLDTHTLVTSRIHFSRNSDVCSDGRDLILNGQNVKLESIKIDGKDAVKSSYTLKSDCLILHHPSSQFILETTVRIEPHKNTELEGLYHSGKMLCTQNEAEGFRKITYFLDRPDIMSVYTTTIVAEKKKYPILLSNGDLVQSMDLKHGRHLTKWHDPHPKPCYLFALVAGDLFCEEDVFKTSEGRVVNLKMYVESKDRHKCRHALQSLKKSMKWDEDVYGLNYDLNTYMIVAVDDFNMGAMENKGLNIFNTAYALADSQTATDHDYENVESVIAHEYFHNWTGNRVTCRDWFQLSLKEGLTVFRDQEFTSDVQSRAVKRIDDVAVLRSVQFAEDSGPMAHPVRPDSYIEINNFYTVTVYNKGAELVRMIQTILGKKGFKKGLARYFELYDGRAVTIEDFLYAFSSVNKVNLEPFKLWYEQAGTPVIDVKGSYSPTKQKYTLTFVQSCPSTPGQKKKKPFFIPCVISLIDKEGKSIALSQEGQASKKKPILESTIYIEDEKHVVTFENVKSKPIPSLFRGFSAPVRVNYHYTDSDLMFLMTYDNDPFNRWDSGNKFFVKTILDMVKEYKEDSRLYLKRGLVETFQKILKEAHHDPALVARQMSLPGENVIGQEMEIIRVEAIHHVREYIIKKIAQGCEEQLAYHYRRLYSQQKKEYRFDPESVGLRSFKNMCLKFLTSLEEVVYHEWAYDQFQHANNMTDELEALGFLVNNQGPYRKKALETFYQKWNQESLVMNKWFSVQATAKVPDVLSHVVALSKSPAFNLKNPNKVSALLGSFAKGNPMGFHDITGHGYEFIADKILEIDSLNPHSSARLVGAFCHWKRFDKKRKKMMSEQLEKILSAKHLSKNVFEIVSKSLK